MRRQAARLSFLLAVALCAGAAAGCGAGNDEPEFIGPTLESPSTAPPFTLRDQRRQSISLTGQRGKVVLLTFLYTHCPDVCPLTASRLNAALRRLGPERRDVAVLAVSVDPAGDTPASVRSFVRRHRLLPQFHYLTGPAPALRRIWRAYHVAAARNASDSLVDHTLYTLLLDRDGTGRVLFDVRASPATIEHDVRQLLA